MGWPRRHRPSNGYEPELFELTGEYRVPRMGEFFLSSSYPGWVRPTLPGTYLHHYIVRRKPEKTPDPRDKVLLYLESVMENEGVHIEMRVDAAKLLLAYT